jgi:hypothetical protein
VDEVLEALVEDALDALDADPEDDAEEEGAWEVVLL